MKEIEVNSHNVPATARSKNYRTAQANTASSGGGGGATSPSATPTTGGASDTAKVAQNLTEDSTDWSKILRKDIDERTENSLSIGKDITVDGKAILNDVVANTGTFAGLLKASSATITGALLASTVNATTVNATTFIGELQGNAATATKLKTARTIWGQSFDGSGNVDGSLSMSLYGSGSSKNRFAIKPLGNSGITGAANWTLRGVYQYANGVNLNIDGGDLDIIKSIDGCIAIATDYNNNALGKVGIRTTTPTYMLDVNGTMRASDGARFDKGAIFLGQTTAPTGLGTYVLNYVSSTYGARVTAYDGVNYQKLSLGKLISGTNFQLELNSDGTSKFNGGVITNGIESSKGGVFFGQYQSMPTSLGTYVANYVSDSYGARILAYDGTAYKDMKLGAMPTTGVFSQTLLANGNVNFGYGIGTANFASRTVGWNINAQGAADFRSVYADEMRVQAFTADISQALAGSDYLTKSVSKLSANFVVPSAGGSVRIIVDDIEGRPATQCFSNGDYIRFRAFNRTSGLTIANVWGTVTLDTSFGTNGFSNGTQAYTFTCTATTGAGLTVFKGSEVLDYGTSGSGMISRTTLDAQGSPYEQIATWQGDPSNSANYTVHARLGNLGGIANCSGHGLYTDNGYFTGSITIGDLTKTNNYLSFDAVNGLRMKLNGSNVATATDISSAITTAASDATTKANSAYSSAVSYTNTQISTTNGNITSAINGIKIGGRNLARLSKGDFTYNLPDISNYNANMCNAYWVGNKSTNIVVSGDVEFSNIVFTGTGTPLFQVQGPQDLTRWNDGFAIGLTDKIHKGNGSFHFSRNIYSAGILNNNLWCFGFRSDYIAGSVIFRNLQVTYGTKENTWTPAPEDVDASIASAQSTAISQAASNAAAVYVTSTAYNSTVTQLQGSISSKVSQTDFNALGQTVGQHTTAIQQNAQDITSKVSSTDYTGNTIASLINQTATAIQIQASKIDLVGAVTIGAFDSSVTAAALGGATPKDVSTAVNNIQIGGRNLLVYSRMVSGWITHDGSIHGDANNIYDPYYTPCNGNEQYMISVDSNPTPKGNEAYTAFYDGSKNYIGYKTLFYNGDIGDDVNSNGSFTTPVNARYIRFGVCYRENICKVEKGTKITDYTPAPEDVVSTAVNNIQIGGRNLIGGTKDFSGLGHTGVLVDNDYLNFTSVSNNYPKTYLDICSFNPLYLKIDQYYTLSFYAKSTVSGDKIRSRFYPNLDGDGGDGLTYTTLTTEWKRYSITWYRKDLRAVDVIVARLFKGEGLGNVSVCGIKFEEGNKATDWTPAPEDVAQDVTNKVNAVSAAHGGFTFLDSTSIYTGTLTANQVNAVGINANSITTGTFNADRIAGNSITGDKIVANSITGDKLVMNTITALGNVTAGSFNIGSGKFVVDANGNTTTVNMTAVNATISGTLNGVSGTFNYLQGVGSNGKFWFDNTFEAMSIKDEDFRQLGRKNTRTLRFYSGNIRCIGSFGALSLNMARVHDTYIDYFVNGDTYSYVRSNLKSNGVGGYYIQLYPTIDKDYSLFVGGTSLGDVEPFPVDLLIFNNSANYHYEMLPGACGKKVIAVNANNNNTVYLAINGELNNWTLAGGIAHTFINIREFMTPSVSSSVHGAGWLSCGGHDNDWK